jgi:hydrogenase maturation protease
MASKTPILVIGLGNRFRSDDGVGLYVADNIRACENIQIKVIDNISDNAALLETWSENTRVFIIDAVTSNGKPGAIYRFDALNEIIPADIFVRYSTHSISIIETVELAKTLAQLPDSLFIFGVEGVDFSPGVGLTPDVEKAATEVIRMLTREVEG